MQVGGVSRGLTKGVTVFGDPETTLVFILEAVGAIGGFYMRDRRAKHICVFESLPGCCVENIAQGDLSRRRRLMLASGQTAVWLR